LCCSGLTKKKTTNATHPGTTLDMEGTPAPKAALDTTTIEQLSIKELKAILAARGVDCRDCFEKRDLVQRAMETSHLTSAAAPAAAGGLECVVLETCPSSPPEWVVLVLHVLLPLCCHGARVASFLPTHHSTRATERIKRTLCLWERRRFAA